MTKRSSPLACLVHAVLVLCAGAPAVSWASFTDLDDTIGYDSAGRTMSWSWDVWSRPTSVTLPVGAGRGVGPFTGFARSFDSLDHSTT